MRQTHGNFKITRFTSQVLFSWVKTIGGSVTDISTGITVDSVGLYTTGYFEGICDADPASSTFNISSAGIADILVHKLGLCSVPGTPVNGMPSSLQKFCSGASATLIATSPVTVNWYASLSSANILHTGATYTIPALSPGTYTYYAEASSCTVSATRLAVTVTVFPLPSVTATAIEICSGESATITATGANSYSWSSGATGSSIVITPSATVIYSLTGTNANGCAKTIAVTQSVSLCTAIDQLSRNAPFTAIYPNPAQGRITIDAPVNISLTIFTVTGNIILEKELPEGKHEIATEGLGTGVYFIHVVSREHQQVTRLVKL